MYHSRYNLVFPIGNAISILFNPLSGSVDIADKSDIRILNRIKNEKSIGTADRKLLDYLISRGYVFGKETDEDRKVNQAFREFSKSIRSTAENFFFVPTYSCNLRCSYCFQAGLNLYETGDLMTVDTMEKAFEAMAQIHRKRRTERNPTVTLYGGEPLLNRQKQKDLVVKILEKCNSLDYNVVIVTNGVSLENYSETLSPFEIREVQVTLDGPKEIHDRRRPMANKEGSFDRIVRGVDAALDQDLSINLRIVLDIENIDYLPKLAVYASEKGWIKRENFKAHTGSVCEFCASTARYKRQLSTSKTLQKILRFYATYPEMKEFIKMQFVRTRNIIDTGEAYPPVFDGCPACDIEYALDLYGYIYPCTATCGSREQAVGKFYPKLQMNRSRMREWQRRNIFTIDTCKKCSFSLICGGGCTYDALLKTGSINAPSCKPIKETLQAGFNYYFPILQKMADQIELEAVA